MKRRDALLLLAAFRSLPGDAGAGLKSVAAPVNALGIAVPQSLLMRANEVLR